MSSRSKLSRSKMESVLREPVGQPGVSEPCGADRQEADHVRTNAGQAPST